MFTDERFNLDLLVSTKHQIKSCPEKRENAYTKRPNVINNVARYIEPMLQKPVNVWIELYTISDKCIRELTNNTIYRLFKLSSRIISASLAPDITVPTHARCTALCDPVMGRIAIMCPLCCHLVMGRPCVCYNDCFISAVVL